MRITKAPSPWQESHSCMERMLRRLSKGMSSFKEFFNFGLNFRVCEFSLSSDAVQELFENTMFDALGLFLQDQS